MAGLLEKDEKFRNSLILHVTRKNAEGYYYCRALNTIRNDDYCYCRSCPLFTDFKSRGSEEKVAICYYYDVPEFCDMIEQPETVSRRIQGMILAGLVDLFPDYIPGEMHVRSYQVLEEALQFAARAHEGVCRKGTQVPYVAHVMETMMLTASMTTDHAVIAAAALHDVVEDTEITLEEIRSRFGDEIADYVGHETENKRKDQPKSATWKIRKMEQLEKTKNAKREIKILMLADKLSNMRASLRDYETMGRDIWKKFNMTDEREQYWYYHQVAEVTKELSAEACYREYVSILSEVFADLEREMNSYGRDGMDLPSDS